MLRYYGIYLGVLLASLAVQMSSAHAQGDPAFGYKLQTDVVYGKGVIAPNGKNIQRDLKLDVFSPSEPKSSAPRPAVVLVHGGAYHRGGRRQPPYKEAGAVHSRMEDYARMLAPLGYVCFVIEYRLAPELPQPSIKPDAPNLLTVDEVVTSAGLARTNFARRAMGLPELAESEKVIAWNAAMAAAEDTKKAVDFVRANAKTYNVDPARIALGGHSAGGGNTLNAAFGLKAPVAAIFPLSPPEMLFDMKKVIAGRDLPATLYVISQYDIDAILEPAPETLKLLKKAGADYQLAWVPGFPHFYPSGAVSLADDGTRMSVGERITEFLDAHLKK
jgi:predicted esterase